MNATVFVRWSQKPYRRIGGRWFSARAWEARMGLAPTAKAHRREFWNVHVSARTRRGCERELERALAKTQERRAA